MWQKLTLALVEKSTVITNTRICITKCNQHMGDAWLHFITLLLYKIMSMRTIRTTATIRWGTLSKVRLRAHSKMLLWRLTAIFCTKFYHRCIMPMYNRVQWVSRRSTVQRFIFHMLFIRSFITQSRVMWKVWTNYDTAFSTCATWWK